MILYAAQGTSNLGDFFNSMPVLSGIAKSYGNLTLILQSDMVRFSGIKDLLLNQDFIEKVFFENEYYSTSTVPIAFNSWVREEQTQEYRPVETCRYEIMLKETHGLNFTVDDTFILKISDIDVPVTNSSIIGDRCAKTTYDLRRKCDIICNSKYSGIYLDYDKTLMYNLNVIKKSNLPFITTFTGISVLVDLMGLPQVLLYDDEIAEWAGRSITDTVNRHYYGDRKSVAEQL